MSVAMLVTGRGLVDEGSAAAVVSAIKRKLAVERASATVERGRKGAKRVRACHGLPSMPLLPLES